MCVCVCYIIVYRITFHPYSSDVLHFAGASLRAPVYLCIGRRKKKYTILISRTTYCTSCGRSTNTRRRMELLKDRKYAYKYAPHARRTSAHSHENTNRRDNHVYIAVAMIKYYAVRSFRSTDKINKTNRLSKYNIIINPFLKTFLLAQALIFGLRRNCWKKKKNFSE